MFTSTPRSARKSRRVTGFGASSGSLSARKNKLAAPRVIHETARHVVDQFAPFPTVVVENLDIGADAAGGIDGTSVAYLVMQRTLFVWKLEAGVSSPCWTYELPRAAYNRYPAIAFARLVAPVPPLRPGGPIGVLSASPSGSVRYWPDAAQDHYHELDVEMGTATASRLFLCNSRVPIVVASDASIFRLSLPSGGAEMTATQIQGHTGQPSGMLQSLSHSLGFGAMLGYSTPQEQRLQTAIRGDGFVLVLTETSLQKWTVSHGARDTMSWQMPLRDTIEANFTEEELTQSGVPRGLDVWLLDVAVGTDGPVALVASMTATPPDDSSVERLLLFSLVNIVDPDTTNGTAPEVASYQHLEYSPAYSMAAHEELLENVRLLLPHGGPAAYVYWPDRLVLTCLPRDTRPLDQISFGGGVASVIGAGWVPGDADALFFFPGKGVVHVRQSDLVEQPVMTPMEVRESTNKAVVVFKELDNLSGVARDVAEAFRSFCQHDEASASALMSNASPGRALDDAVVKVDELLLDDVPTSDGRWAENASAASATSVLLKEHLKVKQLKHSRFVAFLTRLQVWPKLSMMARNMLLIHAEKLESTAALRAWQNEQRGEDAIVAKELIHEAIGVVLQKRKVALGSILSQSSVSEQDSFFGQVTGIDEFIEAIQQTEENMYERANVASGSQLARRTHLMELVNQIFEVMLLRALMFRRQHVETYAIGMPGSTMNAEAVLQSMSASERDPLPTCSWVAHEHVRVCIKRQIDISLTVMSDGEASAFLPVFVQLYSLSDCLLEGYKWDVDTLGALPPSPHVDKLAAIMEEHFSFARERTVAPFLHAEQWERARTLAEKYKDWNALVYLCERENNDALLEEYMAEYGEPFALHCFQWLLQCGMRGRLFEVGESHQHALALFLERHPPLAWLHHVNQETPQGSREASENLLAQGQQEMNHIGRRKNLLSLAKLSAYAGGVDELEDFDTLLHMAKAQLMISPSDAPVLLPEDLIVSLAGDLDKFGGATGDDEVHGVMLAFDTFELSMDARSDDDNQGLLMRLWRRVLTYEDWAQLAAEFAASTDSELLEMLSTRMFSKCVMHTTGNANVSISEKELDSLVASISEYAGNRRAQQNIKTTFRHAMEAEAELAAELWSGEAQQQHAFPPSSSRALAAGGHRTDGPLAMGDL